MGFRGNSGRKDASKKAGRTAAFLLLVLNPGFRGRKVAVERFSSEFDRLSRMTSPARARALSSLITAILLLLPATAFGQEGQLDKSEPKGITTDEIIHRFTAKEKEFKEARDQYTYRQDVRVQTLEGDTVDGEYQQVFDVTFDDKGHKVKNVVFAPQATLQRIMMTEEAVSYTHLTLPTKA